MAVTRETKGKLVDEYVARLHRSQAVIVTEYRGLTVKQMQDLRRDLRSQECEMVVAKNTLMSRALTSQGMAAPESLFSGPTAVTFCYGEVAGPSKTLTRYARDSKIMVVRGGLIGRTSFDATGVQSLAELPGRDQLLGQVVGVIQAPLNNLVNVLAGTLRSLVNVLNARSEQLQPGA